MAVQVPTGEGNWGANFKSGMARASVSKQAAETIERVAHENATQPSQEAKTTQVVATPVVATNEAKPTETVQVATVNASTEAAKSTQSTVQNALTTETAEVEKVAQGPRILKVSDERALVELPGMKAKSASDIARELTLGRSLQQKSNNLEFREQQLKEKEAEIERLRQQQVNQQVKPVTTEVQKSELTAPVRPADAIPGEPEYEEYQAKLIAYNVALANKPLLEKLEARDREEQKVKDQESQFKANLDYNRSLFNASVKDLPFDVDQLSEESQKLVVDRIHAVALAAKIDLRNGAHIKQIAPETMSLIMMNAWPEGSLPPGYSYQTEEVQESEAMRALRESEGKPVVEKAKPDPLHTTGVGAVAVNKPSKMGPVQDSNWLAKLGRAAQGITR